MTRINTFLPQCNVGPGVKITEQIFVLRFELSFKALLFIFIMIFLHLIWFMEMFLVKFKFLPHNLLDILVFKHSSQFFNFSKN